MRASQLSFLLRQLRHDIEFTFVFILSLIVVATWTLAELVDEVVEGSTSDIDRDILLTLRSADDHSDPIGPWWLEEMGRDLTALGGVAALTLMTLVVSVFFLLLKRWRTTLYILVSVGGGILISSLAKEFFDRPRPDLVSHGSLVHSASFPSGHSMMAAVAYLTMGVLIARVQPRTYLKMYVMSVAVLLTVLVGVSRVYLGVHWPTDVAAGWLAGGAWAMICLVFARNLSDDGHAMRHPVKDAPDSTSNRRTDMSPDE